MAETENNTIIAQRRVRNAYQLRAALDSFVEIAQAESDHAPEIDADTINIERQSSTGLDQGWLTVQLRHRKLDDGGTTYVILL